MRKVAIGLVWVLGIVSAVAATADEEISAAWITELKVKTALLDKVGSDAVPIRVRVDRTTAILTGTVRSRSAQELCEEVALSVAGIGKVENRVQLAPPDPPSSPTRRAARDVEQELSDARLESEVKLKLFAEIGVHARKVEVEAVEGVVSLRGHLPDAERKRIALETVERLSRVKKVVDLIRVP